MAELTKQGFIEPTEFKDRLQWYCTTSRGLALASATAAAPVHRARAEHILTDFLRRVEIVNTDDAYLWQVQQVVLFGSYLSGADPVGDIDLAIELNQKKWVQEKWRELSRERVNVARQSGRRFYSFFDRLIWPEQEVRLFLKSRSRTLSLMDLKVHESMLARIPFKVLVGDPEWSPREEAGNGS